MAPGQDVEFDCTAVGVPPPVPVWSRSGSSSLPTGAVTVTGSASNTASLHLFSVSSNDAGTYVCSAGNIHGLMTAQTSLTVLGESCLALLSQLAASN